MKLLLVLIITILGISYVAASAGSEPSVGYTQGYVDNNSPIAVTTPLTQSSLLTAGNAIRNQYGLHSLNPNYQLQAAAQAKCQDMLSKNYWSHTSPNGDEPWDFIDRAGYVYTGALENLAYGFNEPDAVMIGWMNSPGHRENLLDKRVTEVGYGICGGDYQGLMDQMIVVQMSGKPY